MPSTETPNAPLATAQTPQDRRQCRLCLAERPVSAFRCVEKQTGKRSSFCNVCHARREADRKAKEQRVASRRRMHETWGLLARAKDQRLAVERLVVDLLAYYGGHQAMVTEWRRLISESSTDKRIKSVHAVMGLMRWLRDSAEQAQNPAGMSPDELREQEQATRAEVVAEAMVLNPAMVAAIARRHGYTLTRSDD